MQEKIMITDKKTAWNACITVWEAIASGDYLVADDEGLTGFKNRILKEKGFQQCLHGCPFCQKWWATDCKGCPIREYSDNKERGECAISTPYADIDMLFATHDRGVTFDEKLKELAQEFVKYLNELGEKDYNMTLMKE
jgi:hypothetical protein